MQPFVKWFGGKARAAPVLMPLLRERLAERPNAAFVSPFLGGGYVELVLASEGALDGRVVQLSDACEPLVRCWDTLLNGDVAAIIRRLDAYRSADAADRDDTYYAARDRMNDAIHGVWPFESAEIAAATFIYLNKAGYNGLWRVNASGGMNVPKGNSQLPSSWDYLRQFAKSLRAFATRCTLTIRVSNHTDALLAAPNDAVAFVDPPYLGTHVAYVPGKREWERQGQVQFKMLCTRLRDDGMHIVACNASAASNLWFNWEQKLHDVRRSGGCTADSRTEAKEMAAYTPLAAP